MNPLPKLVIAPCFHLPVSWLQRLSIGAGVEQTEGGLLPCPPWQPANAEQLADLVLDPVRASRDGLADCLCLFVVPGHLRSKFVDLLLLAQQTGELPADAFDDFVRELAGFLAFKQLPAPADAVFELVVRKPGQGCALEAPPWGMINFGEDAVAVVFAAGHGHPPVRLRLDPGEGLRLPRGIVVGIVVGESEQPEVLLVVRLEKGDATPAR